jgi:hypothetical protein
MFTMTKEEALKIQAEQVAWYSKYWTGFGTLAEKVASLTTADALQGGVAYPVRIINEHIPRGGDIEHICGLSQSNLD